VEKEAAELGEALEVDRKRGVRGVELDAMGEEIGVTGGVLYAPENEEEEEEDEEEAAEEAEEGLAAAETAAEVLLFPLTRVGFDFLNLL